jgi:hypothetical protein
MRCLGVGGLGPAGGLTVHGDTRHKRDVSRPHALTVAALTCCFRSAAGLWVPRRAAAGTGLRGGGTCRAAAGPPSQSRVEGVTVDQRTDPAHRLLVRAVVAPRCRVSPRPEGLQRFLPGVGDPLSDRVERRVPGQDRRYRHRQHCRQAVANTSGITRVGHLRQGGEQASLPGVSNPDPAWWAIGLAMDTTHQRR